MKKETARNGSLFALKITTLRKKSTEVPMGCIFGRFVLTFRLGWDKINVHIKFIRGKI